MFQLQKIKVLHVLQTTAKEFGGVQTFVDDLAHLQNNDLFDVTIITTDLGSKNKQNRPIVEKNINGIKYIFCKSYGPILFSWSFIKILKKIIDDFDIIHIHGLYRFPMTFAGYLAKKRNKNYILSPHGSLDPYLYNKSTKKLLIFKKLYQKIFEEKLIYNASRIHFTTIEEANLVSHLKFINNPVIIPIGIDLLKFKSEQTRPSQICKSSSVNFCFIGRIHFKKGLDILVLALRKVVDSGIDAQLTIIGPDNDGYGDKIKKLIKLNGLEKNVSFKQPLWGLDLVNAYKQSDIFILPSYSENFGITIIEALACKVPVIISNKVNIFNEINNANAGLVVNCDVDDISKAMIKLSSSDKLRNELAKNGEKLIKSDFTWQKIINKFNTTYIEIINNIQKK